jgi:hypothetical protein
MHYKEKYLKYKYKNSKIISEINDIIQNIKISYQIEKNILSTKSSENKNLIKNVIDNIINNIIINNTT